MENRVAWFLDQEIEPGDEIDFGDLARIKPAISMPCGSDLFARGFIVGYALAMVTAFAAILLCWAGR